MSQQSLRSASLPLSAIIILVAAATIISLSMGLRQSLGLFLPPLNQELAITASSFGLAMALQNIAWGVGQPIVGMLADRYGARPVLIISALIYSGGLLLMAGGGATALSLDGGLGVMVGLGIAGTSYGVLIGSVSRAVPAERRNKLIGLVAAAGSLATFILAPLGDYVITAFGWRAALCVFAGFALTMGLFAVAIGRESNAEAGSSAPQEPFRVGQAFRDALAHRGFMMMTIAFFACGFQLMFITTHLAQFLTLCGVASGVTAAALGLIGLSNAAGSYLFGILANRYSQKRLLASIYFFRTVAIVLFISAPVTPLTTLLFAAAMGFLWLGVIPLVSALIRNIFGLRYFSTLFGLMFFSHQIGGFLGSWLGGVTFDMTGSYSVAWIAMIGVGLTATAIQWAMNDRAKPSAPIGHRAIPQPSPA